MNKEVSMDSDKKKIERKCNCCGVTFDVRSSGVAGTINGKPVHYCTDCCRADY